MNQENMGEESQTDKGKKRNMDSGSNTKKIIIFLFSCSFLLNVHHVQAEDLLLLEYCSNSANYTSNSQFQTNLNLFLLSLLSNGTRNGFFNDTVGSSPDTMYGFVQCRGDISTQDCGTCLKTSTVEILQRCPNRKSAALRYEYCILRYSNSHFSGQADENFRATYDTGSLSDSVTGPFNQQVGFLVKNLSIIAASRKSRDYWGSIKFTTFIEIYGLVQCTTDLSPENCSNCLKNALSWFSSRDRNQGGQIYSTTCYVRYELYPFAQRQPPQGYTPPPPSSTNRKEEEDGNGRGKSSKVVTIIVPVIGGSVLLLANCAFMIIRRTRKIRSKRKPELSFLSDDQYDMRSEDSLQFNLNTIRTATNDFSDDNKLGEGGFGAVYKEMEEASLAKL